MKTIQQVNDRIQSIINATDNVAPTTRRDNLLEINHLRDVVRYLQTDPSEEFIKSEISRLVNIVKFCEESWKEQYAKHKHTYDRMALSTMRARKAEFLKETDLETINKQIRVLAYILK